MNAADTMHLIAEVAIGFTGFAGIVGALGRERLRADDPHLWLGFWTMIEFGLATLLAALLPSVAFHTGLADSAGGAARLTSGVFTAWLVAHLVLVTPLFVRARRGANWSRGLVTLDVATFLCLLTAFVSQSANMLGRGFESAEGGLLLGLYMLLMVSGFNFALLVYLMLVSPGSESR